MESKLYVIYDKEAEMCSSPIFEAVNDAVAERIFRQEKKGSWEQLFRIGIFNRDTMRIMEALASPEMIHTAEYVDEKQRNLDLEERR